MKNTVLTLAFSALALTATTAISSAHSTLEQGEAKADSSYKAVIRIPHGCDGKATTAVKVELPEGFIAAQPQPKAGWEVATTKGDYAHSYPLWGKDVKSGVKEVVWSGGNLPSDYYDEFVVVGRLASFDKDTTLSFPVTQSCGSDASVAWTEIAKDGQNPHDLKSPAPQLLVLASAEAQKDEHAGHDMSSADNSNGKHVMAESVKLGTLSLASPTVRAMVPGAKVAGGFVTITNEGKEADKLVSVTSPMADHVEIHEMTMENQVMKMRELKDGLTIPAGETVELKPGSYHLMFMKPTKLYAEGDTIPATLEFEKGGKVELHFIATPKSGKSASPSEHSGH